MNSKNIHRFDKPYERGKKVSLIGEGLNDFFFVLLIPICNSNHRFLSSSINYCDIWCLKTHVDSKFRQKIIIFFSKYETIDAMTTTRLKSVIRSISRWKCKLNCSHDLRWENQIVKDDKLSISSFFLQATNGKKCVINFRLPFQFLFSHHKTYSHPLINC